MNDVATRQEHIKADIAQQAQNYDLFEFIQGMADCREGVAHGSGESESYDAGYSAQYGLEQMMGAVSRGH